MPGHDEPKLGTCRTISEMPPGDISERQRRAERDAGAGIVAAHDARHVVARGIEPCDHAAIGVQRAGAVRS